MRGKAISRQQNRTRRLLALPARCLTRARDCYVKGMNGCIVSPPKTRIPRSYSSVSASSSSSSDDSEDFRELLRAASGRKESEISNNVVVVQPQMRPRKTTTTATTRRSCSVAMGRIDEEKPCFFEMEDCNINVYLINNNPNKVQYYPRSKSYGVTKRTLGF